MAENVEYDRKYGFIVCFIIAIYIISFLRVKDPYEICLGILCVLYIPLLKKKNSWKIDIFDQMFFLFLLFEIISVFFSINTSRCFENIYKSFFIFIFYLVVRRLTMYNKERKRIIQYFLFVIFIVSIVAIVTFLIFKSTFISAHYENLYEVKNLYKPFGLLLNVWSTYLITFIGLTILACYYNRNNKLMLFFSIFVTMQIVYCIIVTFSRGAYIALAFVLIAFILYFFKGKCNFQKMLFLLALSVTLCVAICPNINEVLRTVRMSESISQVRSVSSRMDIGEASWNAFQEYPIMGVGNNNLTLATNKDLFENDDTSYTSYAPSIIFQLFSEKGIVGLIIWFAMILCVCYFFFRSDRRKIVTCLMFSAIILLVIRELTFSAFFRVTGIQMLAYVIIVLFINSLPQKLIPCIAISAKKWRTISYMPLMGYILILIVLIQQNTDRYNNAEFIKNVVVYKDVNGAQEYIEKTACSTPFLINRSIVYWELFNQTNDTLYLQKAKMNINKAIGKSANDIILKYNMATILQAEGKLDSAFTMINKLVKQYPENSLYNWRLYNIYHLLKEDIKSKNHLKKAIYQNPGLAEVGRVYCILQCDIPLKQSIIEKCKEDNAFTDCNPIRLAKNGKILLSLGDTINAELYLKKAIMLQPNLMVPWQLLQVISRKNNDSVKAMYYKQHYLALSHYVKQGSVGKMQYIDSLQNLFANKYMIKYKEWYGETTIPQLIFIPNEIEQ